MQQEHVLNERNIKKLLIKLSTPAIFGMLVMALYNVVDTIFIGRSVGPLGIAALSIVFPIQMIIMSFGQLVGIGAASVISRSLGAGEIEKANLTLGTALTFTIIISVLLTVFGLIFSRQLLLLFGATEMIFTYAKEYFDIIMFSSILFIIAMSSNSILRSDGRAKDAMYTMIVGAVLNIILDPILIFGFKMGVRGAALATVISQFIAVCYVIGVIQSKKSTLSVKLHDVRLNLPILREITAIGFSFFARNIAGSVVFASINNVLGSYGGDIAIAAYGIIQRFTRFIIMPMFGIAQGVQPIIGYNYGAKLYLKVLEAKNIAIKYATILGTVGFLVVELFSRPLVTIFTNDPQLIDVCSKAMKLMFMLFPIVGFQVVTTTVFQALGKAIPSLIFSLSREILFLLPLVILLPKMFSLKGVWIAYPVSDIFSFVLTGVFYLRLRRELKNLALSAHQEVAG